MMFVISIDRISKLSRGVESITFGDISTSWLFAMTKVCWLHQDMTFCIHWGSLQPAVQPYDYCQQILGWKKTNCLLSLKTELLP